MSLQISVDQYATTKPEDKGFLGERYDEASGLQYLNTRYYDPVLTSAKARATRFEGATVPFFTLRIVLALVPHCFARSLRGS